MAPFPVRAAWLAGEAAAVLPALAGALGHVRRRGLSARWETAAVFAAFVAIYCLSSLTVTRPGPWGRSGFPHYVKLAEALLHGRLYLLEPLLEVALFRGRIYVIEPIFPALLMMPGVAIWRSRFSDVLFTLTVAALNAALVYALWPKVRRWDAAAWPRWSAFWLTVLFGLGTPHWYLSVAGCVWHTAGIVALGCLLLAVHEALGRHRLVLMHAALGCAFLSHPPTVFSLPFFWLVSLHRLRQDGVPVPAIARRFAAGLAVLAAQILVGWAAYNYLRFGDPLETGNFETYRHDVAAGLCPPFGIFSLRYLPRHLFMALLHLPLLRSEFPFVRLSTGGFSLFVATPALVYVGWAVRRRILPLAAWMGAVPVATCLFMYHHDGSAQFGYRWVLDALPFLLILAALGMARLRWRGARALILASVLINGLGVLWFYSL